MKAPDMITIDRENKTGLIQLLKDAKDRISKGRPIAMFPEGTRTDGKSMLPFKPGAAMVANKLKLKVQPVVLINTRSILNSQNMEAKPGKVKAIYLDPVQADKQTDWFKETEVKMQKVLAQEILKES
jgi:1-acyl-sn-glycerol-3-phosphate acyltransferase